MTPAITELGKTAKRPGTPPPTKYTFFETELTINHILRSVTSPETSHFISPTSWSTAVVGRAICIIRRRPHKKWWAKIITVCTQTGETNLDYQSTCQVVSRKYTVPPYTPSFVYTLHWCTSHLMMLPWGILSSWFLQSQDVVLKRSGNIVVRGLAQNADSDVPETQWSR